jgi:hypothetical protein
MVAAATSRIAMFGMAGPLQKPRRTSRGGDAADLTRLAACIVAEVAIRPVDFESETTVRNGNLCARIRADVRRAPLF